MPIARSRSARRARVRARFLRDAEQLESRRLLAATPRLLVDINRQGSEPSALVPVGGSLYFSVDDGLHGEELWRTDGTAGGTVLVSDINRETLLAGTRGSYPGNLTAVGTTLFFAADDGVHGRELWKSGGAGSSLVADIRAGGPDALLENLTAVGTTLFFTADDGVHGRELWRSDGTADGTFLLKDIRAGGAGSSPASLVAVGSTLFFSADDGVNGRELWRSDGTASGTVLVKDIRKGTAGSGLAYLTAVGNTLLFRAFDGLNGDELWKSDGTAAGTALVKDIWPGRLGSFPRLLTAAGSTLYFQAGDGVHGTELWKSDGTSGGTVLVKDLSPGSSGSDPWRFCAAGSTLFMLYPDGAGHFKLWRSDGTATGTAAVSNRRVWDMGAVGDTLFFSGYDDEIGAELWKTNGTTAGTSLVKDVWTGNFSSYPKWFTAVGTTLFFTAADGLHGMELWRSDGTPGGTEIVRDIRTKSSYGSYPRSLTAQGGTVFFSANDGLVGTELWKTDGTAGGTALVKDIRAGGLDSDLMQLTVAGSTLYFSATDGVRGRQLWKSDGTDTGTVIVKDINLGRTYTSPGSYPRQLTTVGATLYFLAFDEQCGDELWKTDGTDPGTVRVKDIREGRGSSYASSLTAVGDTLFFVAPRPGMFQGGDLWKSDGTTGGTVRVQDFKDFADPLNLTAAGTTVFFSRDDGIHGRELWKSDGTDEGTALVSDIRSGVAGSDPGKLTAVGDVLYFTADDGVNGRELWRSTGAGAVLVRNIRQGGVGADPDNLTAVGGTLYFTADDGANGRELWKSTGAGTVLVKDINPGAAGGNPDNLRAVGNMLYFTADDGVNGRQIWRTDGTVAGTEQLKIPQETGFSPELSEFGFTALGSTVLFSVLDSPHLTELWTLRDVLSPPAPTQVTGTVGSGQVQLTWTAPEVDGGAAITDYVVQFKAASASTWSTFDDGESATTAATVTGLRNGTTYVFRVAARNEAGTGAASEPSAILVPVGTPAAPTKLVAAVGDAQVWLTWKKPATNGGVALSDYVVEYSANGGTNWTAFTDGVSPDAAVTVTGLTNGTGYVFRVSAVNAAGLASAAVSSPVLTPRTVPQAPSGLRVTVGNSRATLAWVAPAADGGAMISDYVIQYSTNGGSRWATYNDGTSATPSAALTRLKNGTSYLFRVLARNAAGTGFASDVSLPAVPATTPGAPTGVSAGVAGGDVVLSWLAPKQAGGAVITDYEVQYSSDNGSTWTTFEDGVSSGVTATVRGLPGGVSHVFRVRALNSMGPGTFSKNSKPIRLG